MDNKRTFFNQILISLKPKRRSIIVITTTSLILIFTILFLGCNNETEVEPVYQPPVEKQFGAETAYVQEVRFQANGFTIVGDLRTPIIGDKHPVILMVHGSGNATRHGSVPFEPLIEIFLRQGFAVLSWDKPGSGASTGTFSSGQTIFERAEIVASALQVMLDNPSIDNSKIGLWGISQAGWVMPKALDLTDDIAFMIVVSGGGEDGIEQYAYLVGQVVACDGGSAAQVETVELNWSKMAKATEYNEYREAVDILVDIPAVVEFSGLSVTDESQWNPWPRDIDAFFDPMDVIKHTTIPMLVFFGELDKNVDPVQGAQAYEAALQEAGNNNYTIRVIQDVAHILTPATTGCLSESAGSDYIQEYLDILEDWLNDLIL
jgi:dipeptidyl aminopeptidase/acylaminoacyl peptidase